MDQSNRPRRQGAIRRSAALPARPALPAPEPRAPLGAPTAVRQRHRDATACPACRRAPACGTTRRRRRGRSEEHTSELQSLMRISYDVFCLKKKKKKNKNTQKKKKAEITMHKKNYNIKKQGKEVNQS